MRTQPGGTRGYWNTQEYINYSICATVKGMVFKQFIVWNKVFFLLKIRELLPFWLVAYMTHESFDCTLNTHSLLCTLNLHQSNICK